jgi:hypothetical protein
MWQTPVRPCGRVMVTTHNGAPATDGHDRAITETHCPSKVVVHGRKHRELARHVIRRARVQDSVLPCRQAAHAACLPSGEFRLGQLLTARHRNSPQQHPPVRPQQPHRRPPPGFTFFICLRDMGLLVALLLALTHPVPRLAVVPCTHH